MRPDTGRMAAMSTQLPTPLTEVGVTVQSARRRLHRDTGWAQTSGCAPESWPCCACLQCWRTSPSSAPDQRQKCVALTLSCDLKRRQAGTWPCLPGQPWGPLFQIEPLPDGSPFRALERDLGGTTIILHLICPQAEDNRTVS